MRDQAAYSVTVGDYTGDGTNDLLIGATGAEDTNAMVPGSAYLISSTDLASLDALDGTVDFQIDMEYVAQGTDSYQFIGDPGDETGFSVTMADVDGDGQDAILSGVAGGDDGDTDAGEVYLINADALAAADLADGTADGEISLANVAAQTDSYKFTGVAAGDAVDYTGALHISVSTADLDGDGQADVVIGFPGDDTGSSWSGTSFVLDDDELANADAADGATDGVIAVENIPTQTLSYQINSSVENIESGYQVSNAGDTDGDKIDDLLIGQSNSVDNTVAGVSFLISSADLAAADVADGTTDGIVDLANVTSVSGSSSYQFVGALAFDRAGAAISSAGDTDGDGLDDVFIGASFTGNTQQGGAYLVTAKNFEELDNLDSTNDNIISLEQITNLTTDSSSYIFGGAINDRAGWSVSSAGDLDGDGKDDLLIGAINSEASGIKTGAVYVMNAGDMAAADAADGTTDFVIDLANIAGLPNSYRIDGVDVNDEMGWSVSSAGDIIGTSADDLFIGARKADSGGEESGEAYLASLADLAAADAADGTTDGVIQAQNLILCFAGKTRIATDCGEVPVENLTPGDLVLTVDAGLQPVRWIGCTNVPSDILQNQPEQRPIIFAPGSLGPASPSRELRVSPQHRMLLCSRIAERMFDTNEVLVPAKKLLGLPGVSVDNSAAEVTYYHILLDKHQIVLADGTPTETLLPGPVTLASVGLSAERELEDLFPQFFLPGFEPEPARPIPPGHRIKRFCARHKKNRQALLADDRAGVSGIRPVSLNPAA